MMAAAKVRFWYTQASQTVMAHISVVCYIPIATVSMAWQAVMKQSDQAVK